MDNIGIKVRVNTFQGFVTHENVADYVIDEAGNLLLYSAPTGDKITTLIAIHAAGSWCYLQKIPHDIE